MPSIEFHPILDVAAVRAIVAGRIPSALRLQCASFLVWFDED